MKRRYLEMRDAVLQDEFNRANAHRGKSYGEKPTTFSTGCAVSATRDLVELDAPEPVQHPSDSARAVKGRGDREAS